jgi:hypothetical protein
MRRRAPAVGTPGDSLCARSLLALCVSALCVSACTPPRPTLPTGAGAPFAAFEAAYDEAVAGCRSARSLLAELGLSGRSGGERLRGRINAGIAAPSQIRLEGVAFGRPIFVLASRDGAATLLLVRENRVVRDASPEAIIEALTGVALTPSELLAIVAGCGLGAATPSSGRSFGEEWAAVDADGSVTYLRRVEGRWRVGAAVRGDLQVLYSDFGEGRASTVHLKAGSIADLRLGVSQLEINTTIDPKAFEVNVPPEAAPLSIEELRRAGPLGEGARR